MKAMLISFAVGLMVGVAYALLRVKSPAPPLVAIPTAPHEMGDLRLARSLLLSGASEEIENGKNILRIRRVGYGSPRATVSRIFLLILTSTFAAGVSREPA